MISDKDHMTGPRGLDQSRTIPGSWHSPGHLPGLVDGRIDLWLTHTVQPTGVIHRLYDLLSEDEQRTADRQVTPALRDRSILARGLLRQIIGMYLSQPPETFQFRRSRFGKPTLAGAFAGQCMFNKSHSGDLLLYGITATQSIGVDIECVRENINLERLAKRQLTAHEYELFLALPETERLCSFFRTWTRKEAAGKAVGKGLIFQMGSMDVSGVPDKPVLFHRRELAGGDPDNWYVRDIPDAGEGVLASVSAYGRIEVVNRYYADTEYMLSL